MNINLQNKLSSESQLTQNQGGFRKGIGKYQQLQKFKASIEEFKRPTLTIGFCVIKKAYDIVDRELIWKKISEKSHHPNTKLNLAIQKYVRL